MDHVAIMTKSWKLIPKILSGEKTVESRWYRTKRAPWDAIASGDTVYFKNSGEKVTAKARVDRVLQFAIDDVGDARRIVKKYGNRICLVDDDPAAWKALPRYCILIFLCDPEPIARPFSIDKTGFGAPAAWLTVGDIAAVRRA